MSNKKAVTFDGQTGEVLGVGVVKKTRYRAKLDTISDIKREMAKLYREARSGVVDVPQEVFHELMKAGNK